MGKTYTRKYKYWHSVLAAHPDKKKELLKAVGAKKLSDILITLSRPHTDDTRVFYMNLKTGKRTWIDVEYLGRMPINATGDEIVAKFKKGE